MAAKTLNLFAVLTITALLSTVASAQVGFGAGSTVAPHGVPASVTSFGFGGHPGFHGVPASVTSVTWGNSPFRNQPPFGSFGTRPFRGNRFGFHHRREFGFGPFLGDVVAVPYPYPLYVMDPGVDDSMEYDDDYRGGPTIFDRRGAGASDYRQPETTADEDYRPARPAQEPQPTEAEKPTPPQPTVLVFKDGHQSQVINYAIVGSTLYEIEDGKTTKVALAELDLPATVKQNDARGVDFQVPRM